MNPLWQTLVAAMLVIGAFGYAVWTLMPAAWRRQIKHRWCPQKAALAGSEHVDGCGSCAGCGGCGAAKPTTESVITLHRLD